MYDCGLFMKINFCIRVFSFAIEKGGKKLMAGRKSKYSSNENNAIKKKIWSVALYIRLSQEDEDNRQR